MEMEIYDDLMFTIRDVTGAASQATQKLIEEDIVAIENLGRERRRHLCALGKHLCSIRMKLTDDNPQLGEQFTRKVGSVYGSAYTSMRIYQRFGTYERYLPLIHVSVQRYFADHAYCADAFRDMIAIAKEGRQVTMSLVREEVLPAHESTPDTGAIAGPPPLLEPVEEEVAEDSDPWDMDDDDVLEPQVSAPRTVAANPPKVERVDLDDMREKLIRNLKNELSGAFNSIENFCDTYAVRRGQWFHRFRKGADEALDAIKDWEKNQPRLSRH